ncbi:uncharacterized protein LOC125071355 isoform X2 [Vanessa atalanta]|uniref:uncharacterized protein LOC125071355 isoform X2 n=1 Tax=Vanessa atalanta TaxID=42275 RepID=UPI001FCCF261|nr:uncharacterized protein LOC125071355 isoform X2 [Vanessa atalanta]
MTPTKSSTTIDDVVEKSVSPTSEVGSVPAQNGDLRTPAEDGWRALFEAQQTSMRLLVEALSNPPRTEDKTITLPKFEPEVADSDARAWLATADICLSDRNIQGSQLVLILSKALGGSAATWFSQIAFPNMKWIEFKEIFLSRFDTLETCAATILNTLNSKPQEGESLAAYSSRLFTLLMSRWGSLGKEEIVVSLILAHIGQIEPRLQHHIFSEEISTRIKMQREMMAFSYRKRSYQEAAKTVTSAAHDNKRPKLSSISTNCYSCGKFGHKSFECFSRTQDKQQTTPFSERPNTAVATRTSVTCFNCGVEGHVASRCSKASPVAPAAASSVVKRVDMCGVRPVTGIITQFDNDDARPSTSHEGV